MNNYPKNDIINSTFRSVCQRAMLIAGSVSILYGLLFIYFGYDMYWWSVAYSIICVPLYKMAEENRTYATFLISILFFFFMTVLKTIIYTKALGSNFGFPLILLSVLPIVSFSGRMNKSLKWFIIFATCILFLWLDWRFFPTTNLQNQSLLAIQVFRWANIAIIVFGVTLIGMRYFELIILQQGILEKDASHDALTGLFNRRSMTEIASKEFDRANRYQNSLSVMLCDLDHFKGINDTLGHDSGDLALCHVANLMKKCTRNADSLGRWGGEEFLAVLPNTDANGAIFWANRLHEEMNKTPLELDDCSYPVTATIAVTTVQEGENFRDVFKRVDEILYSGKSAGRNRVVSEKE